MYRPHIPWALAVLLLASPCVLQAQTASDKLATLEFRDGVTIRKDSLFQLTMRFRIQNRIGFTTVNGEDFSAQVVDARVRRCRLRFDGFVLDKRLRYYLHLGFSKADIDMETGTTPQIIRDAIIFYNFTPNFYIGFGQSKLPGNRQRVTSSGNQQFADLSIANAAFNLDRDFGAFAYCTLPMGDQQLLIKGALSTGDGRGASPGNSGMAYTGRMEWLPFGAFTNKGDYSEGDIEMEPRPKLSVGGVYSHNDRAGRIGGQLGADLYAPRSMDTYIADLLLKYNGWA